MCDACFTRFISTRPVKRLEQIRGNAKTSQGTKYLLALSLGPSSAALLYILASHIQGMLSRSGRTSYDLHILHVYDDEVLPSPPDLSPWQEAFPGYTFSLAPLSSALDIWDPPPTLFPSASTPSSSEPTSSSSTPPQIRISDLYSRPKSRTAMQDLLSLLIDRAILSFALQHSFTTILRGDSATRLAEKVMSDVAKGRGGDVSSLLSEQPLPYPLESLRLRNQRPSTSQALFSQNPPLHSNDPINKANEVKVRTAFPLREVLRKDAQTFTTVVRLVSSPSSTLSSLLPFAQNTDRHKPRMMRDVGIDELMETYFADVEAGYPGVVSNVVRTIGKLGTRDRGQDIGGDGAQGAGRGGRCACCGSHIGSAPGGGVEERDRVDGICGRCERDFA
ncbi:putative cytoplasmic tRNA 2-thiolation protein 2 [Elsinoe fawcettii]|nr:putative cytoplasmic tRNA 2-thiolation protein 2 [Elsinoe fawcettii]